MSDRSNGFSRERKGSLFVRNAAILTLTSLLLRTVGIFFRIYLSGKLGAEGMGLYQLIISVYVLGSTFASSGICTAVTRLIAEELPHGSSRSIRHILRRALLLSVLIGIASTLLFFFGAKLIGLYWLRDMRAVPAIQVLSLGFPFMGISSCLRGYFIARRRIGSSSGAQLIEQAVRIAVIMLLIDRLAPFGLAFACLAVLLGDTAAEAVSCGIHAVSYWLDRRRLPQNVAKKRPTYGVLRRITAIAVPISAGRYLNSALRTAENILVPDRLSRFTGSQEVSLSQFGALKGMTLPLLFFPASFLSAMSTLLLPEVSASAQDNMPRVRRAVNRTLQITLLAATGIGGVFFLLAPQLGQLLYHSDEVGLYLRVLAPLVPIMYAESVVDGILKGLNQQVSSLKYSVADSVIRIVMIFFLLPWRGMEGFLFIMVVSNVLTSWLNIHRLMTVTQMRFRWGKWLILPTVAAACGIAVAFLIRGLPVISSLGALPWAVIGLIVMVTVYLLFLPLLGCISRNDWQK